MHEDYPNDFEELAKAFNWALILFAVAVGCIVAGSMFLVGFRAFGI